MCNPAVVMGVGAAVEAVGAYTDASMQRSALRHQAKINEINARLADADARAELARSEREQQAIRLKGANIKGSQRAAIAAGGIDLSSASAQAALTTTDFFTEADAIQAEANGIRSAWGHRIAAGNLRRGARTARAEAKGISPIMAAGTSLLGSASQIYGQQYAAGKVGAGSGGGGQSSFLATGYNKQLDTPKVSVPAYLRSW